MKDGDTITWATFNNVVPIVASALMIAGSFFALQTRLALIEQQQANMILILEKREENDVLLTKLVNDHETRIRLLEK